MGCRGSSISLTPALAISVSAFSKQLLYPSSAMSLARRGPRAVTRLPSPPFTDNLRPQKCAGWLARLADRRHLRQEREALSAHAIPIRNRALHAWQANTGQDYEASRIRQQTYPG